MRRARHWILLGLLAGLALAQPAAFGWTPAAAQGDGDTCQAMVDDAIRTMLENCFVMDAGMACTATGGTVIETGAGRTIDTLGEQIALDDVATVSALPGDGSAWNVARLHLADPLTAGAYAALIVLGPAELTFDLEQSDLPPGSVFTLSTEPPAAACDTLPLPGVVVQTPEKSLTLLRINGVDLAVNGSAVIQPADGGVTVNALTRETILGQTGTVVFAGYSATANGSDAPEVVPFEPEAVANLPTDTLPRMERVPLPGSAQVTADTVLHLRPNASAYTGTQVKAGLPASVFGQSTDGGWLHIRTYDGLIGWVPLDSLDLDVPGTIPAYDAAPLPPLRPFGPVQARGVTTAESNNLRNGPGQQYEIVTTVPYNTELAVYARDPLDEWLLTETPDGLQAWVSTLIFDPTTPFNLAEMPYAPGFEP